MHLIKHILKNLNPIKGNLPLFSVVPFWLLFVLTGPNNVESVSSDLTPIEQNVLLDKESQVADTTNQSSLIELSKQIAQLEIDIEQLRNRIRTGSEDNDALISDIKRKSDQLSKLNEQIKDFEGKDAEDISQEIISLQEVLNVESSIIQKKEEIQSLETNINYSNTPDETIDLILEIDQYKQQKSRLENTNDGVENQEEIASKVESINNEIDQLEKRLDSTQTPKRIIEMIVLHKHKKVELTQLQKGLNAIKKQQAGGMDWEKANAYRIKNLLIYIHGVERDIKEIKSSINGSSETKRATLQSKLSEKEVELNELMADLDLAGGKYTSQEIDPTETSKGLDLQTKIENLKLELLGLKSDLNGFGISEEEQEQILLQNKNNPLANATSVQELVILIDNKENELARLEEMLVASGSSEEVAWEGKLKYEDHTIASIENYIIDVEKEIEEQNKIINGNYSSAKKATARNILSNKNNELQNLIADLELAGGTYTPGQIMVDMAVGSDASQVLEKEPEPLFEKEKPKKDLKKGSKYLLNNVLFAFDKAIIQQSSYKELNQLADLLKEEPNKRVELSGHTDDWGPGAYNQYLSEKRAQAVADFLNQRGINKKRMVVKGYGETQPIAPNLLPNGSDNFEGRKKNRRTEIKVID